MDKQKLNTILEAMQGITYLEWQNLRFSIDRHFQLETSKQNSKFPLTGTENILELYKQNFQVSE